MATHPFSTMPSVIRKYSKAVPTAMEQVTMDVAKAGTDSIIDGTPVDTTQAVGNWKLTHGAPNPIVFGARIPGSKGGSGAGAARTAMKAEAVGRAKFFKHNIPMFFSNMAPYIGVLEHGDNKHRPHAMVAKGLQAMAARARTAKLIIKPK